jgi:hypothetical protein
MGPRFSHIFLLVLFIQTTNAQPFQTKLFFCGLPIERSKLEVLNATKSDSSKFIVGNLKNANDRFYSFDAEIKNYHVRIPSPSKNPGISIYDVTFITGDTIKLRIPTITLTLIYDHSFSRIKAKKSYKIITNKIRSDYPTLRSYPAQTKIDDPARSEQTASFFTVADIDPATHPKCEVRLVCNKVLKVYTVSITYSMKN